VALLSANAPSVALAVDGAAPWYADQVFGWAPSLGDRSCDMVGGVGGFGPPLDFSFYAASKLYISA
jgi:hypothetical protein